MKTFPALLLLSTLISCSAPAPVKTERPSDIKTEEARVLESMHEEPMRNGTKEVQKENGIVTEIWTYQEEHGSPHKIIETLMHKNGELVSHTITDPANKFAFSRQYQKGKVIELSEVRGDRYATWYFKDEKPIGRFLTEGGKSECHVYEKAEVRLMNVSECEKRFNTSP